MFLDDKTNRLIVEDEDLLLMDEFIDSKKFRRADPFGKFFKFSLKHQEKFLDSFIGIMKIAQNALPPKLEKARPLIFGKMTS